MGFHKKSRRGSGPLAAIFRAKLLALLLALLVCDSAAGLASGLAGSLAFAASAVLLACAEITGLNSLDMFHFGIPPNNFLLSIISQYISQVNTIIFIIIRELYGMKVYHKRGELAKPAAAIFG